MSLTEKVNDILKPLGLAAHMETLPESPHFFDVDHLYNQSVFKFYSPSLYRNNKGLKEMDEIYRFDTTVFLHLSSGIRCEYNIHENYLGEEYKLGKLFVISAANERLDVLDVDYKDNYVVTEKGKISFDKLKRHVDRTD